MTTPIAPIVLVLITMLGSAFAAHPAAAAPAAQPAGGTRVAMVQVPETIEVEEEEEEEEEDVPVPLEVPPTPPAAKDSAAAGAGPDTTGALPDSIQGLQSAEPETLRFQPPGDPPRPGGSVAGGGKPPEKPPAPPKPKSIFGLTPVVILLGLTVLHVLVVRTVAD